MDKIDFEDLPSTNTPINATNLNQLQTNVENAITEEVEKATKDSGWIPVTLEDVFGAYNDNENNIPRYRKIANSVNVCGIITPTSTIKGGIEEHLIFTLPSEYRPSGIGRSFVCQGSSMNRWLLGIKKDGGVYFSRYGTTDYSDCANGNWLTFDVTFLIN